MIDPIEFQFEFYQFVLDSFLAHIYTVVGGGRPNDVIVGNSICVVVFIVTDNNLICSL